ncbi:glutamate 5-kinase [bacterium]|nr:glutamate 5-kinase [bacterium]
MIEIPDIQHSGRTVQLRKLVIKLGSAVIAGKDRKPDEAALAAIADSVAALRKAGVVVILVSSGAIGMGRQAFPKFKARTIPDRQALASIGQVGLMHAWNHLFLDRGLRVAQVLLTRGDMEDRRRYLNTRYTLERLTALGAVPIINENDTVTVDELKFGDNDELSAVVATKIDADMLVILSVAPGLLEKDAGKKGGLTARVIPLVEQVDGDVLGNVSKEKSSIGLGGMGSKLTAVRMATQAGVNVVIAGGKTKGIIEQILSGRFTGTYFAPVCERHISGRGRWLAFGRKPHGKIIVDSGARDALVVRKKSLLPAGIKKVEGEFDSGDLVEVCDPEGNSFARGLVSYDAATLTKIKGKKTIQIREILGELEYEEAIHRDNLVVW